MITTERAEQNVRGLLIRIGENPDREGLLGTPERVVRSFNEIYAGYHKKAEDVLDTTFGETDGYNQMVILKDCEFFSTCEHHMLPFFGNVHIGYIPGERVVGISKLARLVEVFSRRLQIQERMTEEIANAIQDCLAPEGCMVVVEAQHFCMTARGVMKQHSIMATSSVRGVFSHAVTRAEFLSSIRNGMKR